MQAVTIRAWEPADRDAVRDVFRRASLSNAGDRAALLAHPHHLVWTGDTPGTRTRVAVVGDGVVVGFATIVIAGGTAELEDLFADPDRMRQGVATRLVADLAQEAAGRGVRRIEVTANRHAAAFYVSAGFVPDGEAQTAHGPAPRMRLDLGPPPTPTAGP